MKSRELQKNFWEWLATAERLQRSLAEQGAALALRDAGRVTRIQPELERMQARMGEIDQLAAASTRSLAEVLGVQPRLRSIVEALEPAEARQVETLATRIKAVAANVKERLERNRILIQNELDFVNGSMAIVATVAMESQPDYGSKAQVEPVLVNQVA